MIWAADCSPGRVIFLLLKQPITYIRSPDIVHMISPNTIQQILGRIDIIDVVGSFVKLKKEVPITWDSALFIMKNSIIYCFSE